MSSKAFADGLTKRQKNILEEAYEMLLAKEHLLLEQTFCPKTVAGLVNRGLLEIKKMDRFIWAEDAPRIEGMESVETVRLTEEGERIAKTLGGV